MMARFKDRKTECWTYPRMSIFQEAIDRQGYLSFLDETPGDDMPLHLYLHIPFCKQFCVFCPYFKKVYGATERSERLTLFRMFARELELHAAHPQIAGRSV